MEGSNYRLRQSQRRWLRRSPAMAAFLLNVGAAGASFVSTTVLARTAGAAVLGNYAFAMTTASVLTVLALLGLDRIAIRTVAGDLREGLQHKARGTLLRMRGFVQKTAVGLALIYAIVILLLPIGTRLDASRSTMLAAAIGVCVVPVLRVGLGGLRTAGFPVRAQALEGFASYGFALILLVFLAFGITATSAQAVLLFVGLQAVAAVVVWRAMDRTMGRWGPAVFDKDFRLWTVGVPLMLVTFVHISADWILLSFISAHGDAGTMGIYRVAAQIISLPMLAIATAETWYAPMFAGDFRAGRPDLAWQRQRRANRVVIATTAPPLLFAVIFAEPLLGTVFGPEFVAAAPALRIMAAGQMVNVMTGPVGGMLTMAGRERELLGLAITGMVVLVLLGIFLVPAFGLAGAAMAWAVNSVIRCGGAWLLAHMLIVRSPA
ncbi:MAG: polysaccharide biosynthesis C-terminal domain-containing protein [Sphingomonadaceae bacterium]